VTAISITFHATRKPGRAYRLKMKLP